MEQPKRLNLSGECWACMQQLRMGEPLPPLQTAARGRQRKEKKMPVGFENFLYSFLLKQEKARPCLRYFFNKQYENSNQNFFHLTAWAAIHAQYLFALWNKSPVSEPEFLTDAFTVRDGSHNLGIRIKTEAVWVHTHSGRPSISHTYTSTWCTMEIINDTSKHFPAVKDSPSQFISSFNCHFVPVDTQYKVTRTLLLD